MIMTECPTISLSESLQAIVNLNVIAKEANCMRTGVLALLLVADTGRGCLGLVPFLTSLPHT